MKNDRLVWLVTTPLLAAGIVDTLCHWGNLAVNTWGLVAAAAVCAALFWCLDRLKTRVWLWAGLAGLALLGWYVLAWREISVGPWFSDLIARLNAAFAWLQTWLADPEQLPEAYNPAAANLLAWAALAPVTLGVYVLERFRVSRLALALGLPVGAVVAQLLRWSAAPLAVWAVLLHLLLVLTQASGHRQWPERPRLWLSFAPIVLVVSLAAAVLPSPEKPISWQWVADAVQAAGARIEIWREDLSYSLGWYDDTFSVRFAGYSGDETTTPGEAVLPTDDDMLFLESRYRTRSPLYLRGTVRSDYLGTGWDVTGDEGGPEEYRLEALEMLYCLGRSGVQAPEDEYLFTSTNMNYHYGNLLTKTLFYPLGTFQIGVSGNEDAFQTQGANLRFYALKREGLTYNLRAFQLNYGCQALVNLLRSLPGYETATPELAEGGAFYTLARYCDLDTEQFDQALLDTLAQRAASIKARCLQLPRDLPQRVYDLAGEITAGCGSDYDRIRAIETFLAEHYTYTRTPGAVPEGADLADWFLFDANGGYCTYFATAAAVLCRCAGVPARYVEGALTDFRKTGEEGWFLVESADAHAWAEAWLEGFGWVELDPSPGYYAGKHTTWAKKPVPVEQTGSEEETQEQTQEQTTQTEDTAGPQPEPEPQSEPEQAWLPAPEPEPVRPTVNWTRWLLVTVGAALLLTTTLLLAGRAKRARQYRRADNAHKVRLLCRDMLRMLALTGWTLEPGETLSEFTARAGDENLTLALPLVQQVLYGQRVPTDRQLRTLIVHRNALRRNALQTLGPGKSLRLRTGGLGKVRAVEG